MTKIIKCPYCNYEYLPGEIFSPKHFLGQPERVIRTRKGEIVGYEGIEMDTEEYFECLSCGNRLNIVAKVNFYVDNEEQENCEQESQVELFSLE